MPSKTPWKRSQTSSSIFWEQERFLCLQFQKDWGTSQATQTSERLRVIPNNKKLFCEATFTAISSLVCAGLIFWFADPSCWWQPKTQILSKVNCRSSHISWYRSSAKTGVEHLSASFSSFFEVKTRFKNEAKYLRPWWTISRVWEQPWSCTGIWKMDTPSTMAPFGSKETRICLDFVSCELVFDWISHWGQKLPIPFQFSVDSVRVSYTTACIMFTTSCFPQFGFGVVCNDNDLTYNDLGLGWWARTAQKGTVTSAPSSRNHWYIPSSRWNWSHDRWPRS